MTAVLVLLPAAGALLSLLVASDRVRRSLLVLTGFGYLATIVTIWAGGVQVTPEDAWIGIDPLGLLFLVVAGILFTMSSVSTVGFLAAHEDQAKRNTRLSREAVFTGLMLLFLSSMTLAMVSQHVGVFWMAIEMTTLVSAPLISFQRSGRSLEAAWKYLLICSVGIALALIGNIALAVTMSFAAGAADTPLTFGALITRASSLHPLWLKGAFAFLLVGYGTKMGLAPLHTWLPDAHSEAPSSVSALLSGVLLNCAFLGVLRINTVMRAAGLGVFSGRLLVVFGLFSAFLAGWMIVRQTDFKRLLAYSSIEHMGLLSVSIGAGVQTQAGGMLHVVNHSLTKGMLFLVAGNILSLYRTKSIRAVSGIARISPLTGILWTAGFLAISGLPPFGAFISELAILTGIGREHRWTLLALTLFALAVVFIGMSRAVISMVYGAPPALAAHPETGLRRWSQVPPLVLLAALVVLGTWIPKPLGTLLARATLLIGVD